LDIKIYQRYLEPPYLDDSIGSTYYAFHVINYKTNMFADRIYCNPTPSGYIRRRIGPRLGSPVLGWLHGGDGEVEGVKAGLCAVEIGQRHNDGGS
jgi:hypothetical protein